MHADPSSEDAAKPFRHRRTGQVLVTIVTLLAASLALAAPASATTTTSSYGPAITKLSNNALRLSYKGNSYTCYYGDLCVYRGGKFASYYKCQTPSNTTTSLGWAVNNQVGSGGRATFYARSGSGYTTGTVPPDRTHSYYVAWSAVSKFRTCT